ncbi:site-specific integrase [Aestuariibaculum sediminum]|uniref:Site-specific integrase n=1 Tax=Aestuariibaculum sediminum TaxID=2770637 RepID=A0A8J6UCX0_9FLAO|nr:site-specific integrase [Aestuariibaculum sediminum]MBD0832514.1 site-specific integrase [Aestuariibaculum sediminum]
MKTTKSFSIGFWLKKTAIKSDGQIPIYARIRVDGVGADISIKRTTFESHWCSESSRLNPRVKGSQSINMYLDDVYADLMDCHRQLYSEGRPITSQKIKLRYLGKDKTFEKLSDIIRYHKEVEAPKLSQGTLKNYGATEKYLKRFIEHQYKTSDIQLQFIDYLFIVDFENYLRTCKPLRSSQPLNNNGVMKHMERFQKLVNIAVKFGCFTANPFNLYGLKYDDYDSAFLEIKELNKLKVVKLKESGLLLVRDLFLFSCYTGLTYTEVELLKKGDIVEGVDGDLWIDIKRKKTKTTVKVPLLPQANEILERYSQYPNQVNQNRLLPVISNQKVNKYLKTIAKLAGINKHLTFHVARHTFATTITLLNDVPFETVSKLLGHTKLSTTQKYARVIEKKISKDMGKLKAVLDREKVKYTSDLIKDPVQLRIV